MAPEAEAQRCSDRSPLPATFSPGSGGRLSPTEGTPAARGRDSDTVVPVVSPPVPVSPWSLTAWLGVPQQPVDAGRGAAGGDGARRALPGHLDRGAEQVHLLPVGAVDVVLRGQRG